MLELARRAFVRYAPFLAFGVVFLYWEGYVFLSHYFYSKYGVPVNLNDFLFQEVLISGINPFLVALVWLAKQLTIFEFFKEQFIGSESGELFLDFLVFSLTLSFLLIAIRYLYEQFKKYWNIFSKVDNKYLQQFFEIIFYKDIFKTVLLVATFVFITLFLPRWAAFDSSESGLSYRIITKSVSATIIYNGPVLVPQDACNEENICFGVHTVILDGGDYLYLDPGDKCKIKEEVGYNFDTGANGEKIITNSIFEERTFCNSVAISKYRVLEIVSH